MRKLADLMLAKLAPKSQAQATCMQVPEYFGCVNGLEWDIACGVLVYTGVPCKG